jgi:hypothetical protein
MGEQKNPSGMSEHERKNEGGRESGHVHEPSQAQQASRNQGLADRTGDSRKQQQNAPGQQQSGSGSHEGSSSQQGKPPGSTQQEPRKEHQGEREKRTA